MTEQEQKDFMQEMASDYYYEFVAFLLCTGMRFGEAAALTWGDIDYKQNVIHVTKTVTFNEDNTRTTGTPKSESGKRDIPLNDTIKGILAKQRKKQSIVIPIDKAENRVFVSVYGKMVDNCTVNRAISSALSRLEEQGRQMEHFTAHQYDKPYDYVQLVQKAVISFYLNEEAEEPRDSLPPYSINAPYPPCTLFYKNKLHTL